MQRHNANQPAELSGMGKGEPQSDDKLATCRRLLAQRYGGDANLLTGGTMAGLQDQKKPMYRRPYVLAERCNGKLAEKAFDLLQ